MIAVAEPLIPLEYADEEHTRGMWLIRHLLIDAAQTPELLKLKAVCDAQKGTAETQWDLYLGAAVPEAVWAIGCDEKTGKDTSGFYVTACAKEYGLDPKRLAMEIRQGLTSLLGVAPTAAVRPSAGGLERFLPLHRLRPAFSYPNAQFAEFLSRLEHRIDPAVIAQANRMNRLTSNPVQSNIEPLWAAILNREGEGTYFPVSVLEPHAETVPWPKRLFAVSDSDDPERLTPYSMAERRQLLSAAASVLASEHGIHRMSYFRDGGSSVVFCSVPDSNGRMQLVTLTPSEERAIPHPAMLSDKRSHTIRVGNARIDLRVSPALSKEPVAEEETLALAQTFRRSGLDPWDLHDTSTGEVRWVNALTCVEGEDRLIYCADRGAVRWPLGVTETQKAAMIAAWEADPALDQYRAMNEKLMTGYRVENTFTPELVRQVLPKEGRSEPGVMQSAIERGLYPSEVQALSLAALQSAWADEDPGERWRETFRDAVRSHDVTISPVVTAASVPGAPSFPVSLRDGEQADIDGGKGAGLEKRR